MIRNGEKGMVRWAVGIFIVVLVGIMSWSLNLSVEHERKIAVIEEKIGKLDDIDRVLDKIYELLREDNEREKSRDRKTAK